VGGGLVGPSDLNVEYQDGGFRAEVEFLGRVKRWNGGLAVGFRNFEGRPRFNYEYVSSPIVDDPRNSSLEMFDIGLRFGQWYGGSRAGPRFGWTLGPSLVRVYEEADVHVLSAGNEIGRHQEWRARWRGAGDLRLGFGWGIEEGRSAVGLEVAGYVVSWRGESRRSLTSDFLGERAIHGFDATLAFTFGGR